jgi:phage terminase large subunit-like protein
MWGMAADPGLKIEEFAGQEAVFVLDLASKIDVCAFAQLFKKRINNQDHYYAFARYYLPEETIQNDPKNAAMYRKWVIQGHLTPTDGAEIDFDLIGEDVKATSAGYQVREIAYDPWRATQLAHQLMEAGAECVEFAQQVKTMSAPMKELEAAVRAGRFHHDGNPVTTWMVSNVTAKLDAKDNIYPRKEKPNLKIDGAVAIIMGIGRLMTHDQKQETSIYESCEIGI